MKQGDPQGDADKTIEEEDPEIPPPRGTIRRRRRGRLNKIRTMPVRKKRRKVSTTGSTRGPMILLATSFGAEKPHAAQETAHSQQLIPAHPRQHGPASFRFRVRMQPATKIMTRISARQTKA